MSGPKKTDLSRPLRDVVNGMRQDVLDADRVARIADRLAPRVHAPTVRALHWTHWTGLAVVALGIIAGTAMYSTAAAPNTEPKTNELPTAVRAATPEMANDGSTAPSTATESALANAHQAVEAIADEPPRSSGVVPRRRRETAREDPVETPVEVDAIEEHRLVREARHALRSAPSLSLDRIEEHERRFSRGLLAQERDYLRVLALSRLGRESDARRSAIEFLRRWPTSAYRAEIERVAAIAE